MDKLKQQLNINFLAPYQHMQLASRLMSRLRRGSIANIVSQVSEQGSKGMSAYAASKAALTGATKSLAKELAPVGIRVNAVAPGFIDTPLTEHYEDETRQKVLQRTVLQRAGTAKEVADAVLYLLSEQAGYTTGHVLPVDGLFCP
jgi:3-oxoacyl-[acyl-carrier protein] reductase